MSDVLEPLHRTASVLCQTILAGGHADQRVSSDPLFRLCRTGFGSSLGRCGRRGLMHANGGGSRVVTLPEGAVSGATVQLTLPSSA